MSALSSFGAATRAWFERAFGGPTRVQELGWPLLCASESALLIAPTGSGKTLAAFLASIDRLLCLPPSAPPGVRVVYVSPLKALVHDVERNLRAPLAGIAREAERRGEPVRDVRVDMRTGDTPAAVRRKQLQRPADILVTTPESLFLLLTSQARDNLRLVETVIVDEIHVLAGSKRGVHLALSLERLAELTSADPQRVGLSATQRPLERARAYLGGSRAVAVVDAAERPKLSLAIKVPIEDMEAPPPARQAPELSSPKGRARGRSGARARAKAPQPAEHGLWPSVYPELLREIRAHRSTLVFTNSRLLCERLAQKLNELAGEPIVRAHHGSLSQEKRREIEEQLKAGALPALVATSSLELGIDMGAIDLVLLVESPGAVSTGLQRVGRAGHAVGEVSRGVIYPKFRGDLLESAVVARGMLEGAIEETRTPHNCLDVLAQHIVAMVAVEDWQVDELFEVVRRAAPYGELSRDAFESVLDMLSGRYPSDELAQLTPRLNWDRARGLLSARPGARALALLNAGTIPDRGLYRVQVAGSGARLGELDEEMVYETRQGDTIVLGASAWRVEDVQQDRVLVSPAPGQPGRLPFWRGERAGRPLELGRAVGAFLRELVAIPPGDVDEWLRRSTVLDERGRRNLAAYVQEQREAGEVPTDTRVVVERFRDELGDWRVCVLTPFGRRLHAPWALALEARLGRQRGYEVQVLYGDDGLALQLPDGERLPSAAELLPSPEEVEELVVEQLGRSALFAARFREAAARALLLPRRCFGARSPLWLQRRRSSQLLAVAQKHPRFPIVLETYRECLQDVFDMPALVELLEKARKREVEVRELETPRPSPFARSLVFEYVAAYLYDGDAPLAERKAAALALDRSLLRELLGQEELRELLVPSAIEEVERELARTEPEGRARHADALHDLLRRLGDLTLEELRERSAAPPEPWLEELSRARRAVRLSIGGEERFVAVEDAARYRDALGVRLPAKGIDSVFLEKTEQPLRGLVRRFARGRGPFTTGELAARFGIPEQLAASTLAALEAEGALVHAEIRPGGTSREWCDPEVLRRLRRRSLAHLRREVAPVDGETYARFLLSWHGIPGDRSLQEAVAQLEGVPIAFSDLEREVLPARVSRYEPRLLDELGASGALLWVGRGALGARDGRIALYRREKASLLMPSSEDALGALSEEAAALYRLIDERGASFFVELQAAFGAPSEKLLPALWELVWAGLVTNDTFGPLRGLGRRPSARRRTQPTIGGRWSSLRRALGEPPDETARSVSRAEALLARFGVVSREAAEGEPGGFAALYPVLREMEERGIVRRGLFVEGVLGAQFALPGAIDRLRAARAPSDEVIVLAADDPASPWGAMLPWPSRDDGARPRRVAGAIVILVGGAPVLYLEKGERSLLTFARAEEDPSALTAATRELRARRGYRSLRVGHVDGEVAARSAMAPLLLEAGFIREQEALVLARS